MQAVASWQRARCQDATGNPLFLRVKPAYRNSRFAGQLTARRRGGAPAHPRFPSFSPATRLAGTTLAECFAFIWSRTA